MASRLVPLLFAGTSGSAPAEEPAFSSRSLVAALDGPAEPAASRRRRRPAATEHVATPDQPPPVEAGEIAPITVELPPPDEPPPLDTADLKPVEPPKPRPQPPSRNRPRRPSATSQAAGAAKPARHAAKPAVTQTATAPDTGTAQVTQTAARRHHRRSSGSISRASASPPRPAVYPPRAIELGHQGEALVRVRLEPDGSAAEIVLWRGSGFELLDKAALAAVRGWQFLPAMRDGHAVAAWVEIPVRFHLR